MQNVDNIIVPLACQYFLDEWFLVGQKYLKEMILGTFKLIIGLQFEIVKVDVLVNTLLIECFTVLALTNKDIKLQTTFQLHQKLFFCILIDRFRFLVSTGDPKWRLYFGVRGVFVCQYGESLVLVMIGDYPQIYSSHTILFSKMITNYQG